MKTAQLINDILNDCTVSNWFKTALRGALERDAVDAANDAEMLSMVLINRAHEILKNQGVVDGGCVPL